MREGIINEERAKKELHSLNNKTDTEKLAPK
jgi:hypothetical protein